MRLLNRKQFKVWLEEQEPEKVIGECKNPWQCPIANYLKQRGVDEPKVSEQFVRYYTPSGNKTKKVPPIWTKFFIIAVDEVGVYGQEVTAKKALEILEKVGEK